MSKEVVLGFLAALEARDLDKAQGYLAPGAEMTFPGGNVFTALQDLVAWSKGRYRSVRKTYDHFDVSDADGVSTVYCFGMLHGEGLDGKPFTGVRFIDRFEIRDGRITGQQVWNDLAEFL